MSIKDEGTKVNTKTHQDEKYKDLAPFSLKKEHLKAISKHSIIMHPLPRRQELDPAIDNDPRAMYWRQERNGLWTRVALITMIFGVDEKVLLPRL